MTSPDRTVTAKLKLDASDYIKDALLAAKATDALADAARRASHTASAEFDKMRREAEKDYADLTKAAKRSGDDLVKAAEETGDKLVDAARKAGKETVATAAKAGKDAGASLGDGFRRDSRGRFAKAGEELGEDAVKLGMKLGVSTSKGLFAGMHLSFRSLPPQVQAVLAIGLAAAVATAAPAIGAIVGGAVIAGVGAAGIGVGVALSFQDPRVVDAAGDLGMRAKNAFITASAGMIEPTIQSLDVLGDAAVDVAGEMGDMWNDLAPEVVPVAEAIGDMARNAMPGLRDATEAAKPALRILARELPEIGDAFSDMFSTISEEGDGAMLGLVAILDGVQGAIRTTGDAIAWLSARFEDMVRSGAETTGNLEDLIGWFPVLGDKIREANDRGERWLKTLEESKQPSDTAVGGLRDVRDAADEAGKAAEDAASRFEDLFSQWMGVDQSAIAVRDALRDVTESIEDNGRAFNDGTEAGDENAKSFLRAAEAAETHRQKMIASGQSIPYANKVFQETVDKLYAQAAAAGIDMGALDGLLGKYRDLANAPNIVKTVRFEVQGVVPGGPRGVIIAQRHGGIVEHAQTGLLRDAAVFAAGSRPLYAFAEPATRGEAFIPKNGDRARSVSILQRAASWYGQRVMPVGGGPSGADLASAVSAAVSGAMGAGTGRSAGFDEVTLGRALRSALRGVSVRLDGRAVGEIEARRADLYARGG